MHASRNTYTEPFPRRPAYDDEADHDHPVYQEAHNR